jgi:hypothetical protein
LFRRPLLNAAGGLINQQYHAGEGAPSSAASPQSTPTATVKIAASFQGKHQGELGDADTMH